MKLIILLFTAGFIFSCNAMDDVDTHKRDLLLLYRQTQHMAKRDMIAAGVLLAGVAAKQYIEYARPDIGLIAYLPMLPGIVMLTGNIAIDYCIQKKEN